MTMTLRLAVSALCLAWCGACAAAAAVLPIERGVYVREGYACEDPPDAAILDFASGRELASAHDEGCTGTFEPQGAGRYARHVACRPAQAGPAPARAYREDDEIRVLSRRRFELARRAPGGAGDAATFRLCPGLGR